MSEYTRSSPESPSQSLRESMFSRRNVLQLGMTGLWATTLTGMGILTWDSVAKARREHTAVSIQPLPDAEAENTFAHTTTLYLPGLKNTWHESHDNLVALQPSLRHIGRMASLGYSNKGFDVDEVADTILTHLDKNRVSKVNLYGGSFSGMVATQITPRLQAAGYEVPVIFCDSSPSGPADVIDQITFRCMAWAAKYNVSVPDVARLVSELSERAQHKNERSLLQIIEQSFEQITPQACSTELAMTQVNYIDGFEASAYRDQLGATKMAYLGNAGDVVVNNPTAFATWRDTYPNNMHQTAFDTGEAYHASPKYGKDEYNQQLGRVIELLDLVPPRKRRSAFMPLQ